MKKTWLFFLMVMLLQVTFVLAVEPFGASNVSVVNTSRAVSDAAQSAQAQAGNVTELNIQGFSTTQSWQGYFGNITGSIMLADANDNVLYNWSLASPQGEIYASNSSSITWANAACFNWSANGTSLESAYNIEPSDVDGVNETFSYSNDHELFYTNNIQFNAGQCMTAFIFDNTGASVDNNFEEVLMTDGQNIIFTSLLEQNLAGFDNKTHDFEMLVLEDGHGTNVATTTYYFWLELE